MRFGNWRGVTLAIALASSVVVGLPSSLRADGFHTIPREVEAVDLNNGGPYFAPPIPYGHYAKDNAYLGYLTSPFGLLKGKLGGLFHHGDGSSHGGLHHGKGGCADGNCGGNGNGGPCITCGGSGCGFCQGKKLLHGLGNGCGGNGLGGLHCGKGIVAGNGNGCFGKAVPAGVVLPTEQTPVASAQCLESGCFLKARHFHRRGNGCNRCSGNGCGSCQDPGLSAGKLCGSCHGNGCGLCGGKGLFGGHGGGTGCNACGGRGCGLCQHLAGKAHSILGLPHALLAKLTHQGEIKWFVGAGGPVPLTPGYVPYVVTTRSPRDYFAFPPFSDLDP